MVCQGYIEYIAGGLYLVRHPVVVRAWLQIFRRMVVTEDYSGGIGQYCRLHDMANIYNSFMDSAFRQMGYPQQSVYSVQ